jgi:hypothetical protein
MGANSMSPKSIASDFARAQYLTASLSKDKSKLRGPNPQGEWEARPHQPEARRQTHRRDSARRGENVVDLMDALRKSVGGGAGQRQRRKKARKAAAGQKEMLMPIAGKRTAKEVALKPAANPQRKSP